MDMFDDDDTLMYEPALTAAVIMTGDDEEAEKAALEVRRHVLAAIDIYMNPLACWQVLCECHLHAGKFVPEVQDEVC